MGKINVSATVIIISLDKKALIVQRSEGRKLFPKKWIVVGGKMEERDGTLPNADNIRYFSAEYRAIQEVLEETGIELGAYELKYLCSLTLPNNRVVISYYIQYPSLASDIKVVLNYENMNYAWITKDEINDYDFVAGMGEEIRMVFGELGD